ncbi:hypothetical protein [Leifsonia sp. PS1209]|uniref:hypothetical protein n=1 Tax=Leifsonia sp. PS1209 TaxID=2724914 RepID=UPI001442D1D8|nr:hypothetical protein [Leifsonia sp. PS1209]QIZ99528.1 hypothetical protein HF024_14100 [Leifsonia sp. PS1209]
MDDSKNSDKSTTNNTTPKQPWWVVGRVLPAAIALTVFFAAAFALSFARLLRTDLPDANPLLTWGGIVLGVIGFALGVASIVYHLRRRRGGRD